MSKHNAFNPIFNYIYLYLRNQIEFEDSLKYFNQKMNHISKNEKKTKIK